MRCPTRKIKSAAYLLCLGLTREFWDKDIFIFHNCVQTEFEDTGVGRILRASVSWICCVSQFLEDTCWESRFLDHTNGDSNWAGWGRTQIGKETWIRWFSSVQFSCSVVSDSLWPHGLQHTRPPYPSPTPGVYSNWCPLSQWFHPTISSSVVPFSSCLHSFPATGSFPISHFSASGGQNTGVSASASVLPMNIQDWFPLGWTGWISLLSKGLLRVFFNTTVQKHQFFSAQLSL